MTTQHTEQIEREELILRAMQRAFSLGSTYGEQCNTEVVYERVKAKCTLDKFDKLVADTESALLAEDKAGGEPVAECVDDGEGGVYYRTLKAPAYTGPLYTHPQPQAERVPLTDGQIAAAMTGQSKTNVPFGIVVQIARAIEAAHGIYDPKP